MYGFEFDLNLIHIINDIFVTTKQELRNRPCPIVFAAFSGGPKACMYKVFQVKLGSMQASNLVFDSL